MYRVLAENAEVRERRDQLRHPDVQEARAAGDGAEPGLELGHHQAAGPGEVDVLLPLRDPRHLQPLRRRLDGRPPRERRAGDEAHRGNVRAAGDRPGPADRSTPTAAPSMTSKSVALLLADLGVTQEPLAAERLRRQPVLRGAVQDAQVPAGLSRALRLASRTRAPTAAPSSTGTTASIATAASACSRRTTFTTASPISASPRGPRPRPPRTPRIPSAFLLACPRRRRRQLRFGSTHQRWRRSTPRRLTKLEPLLSHSR